MKRKEKQQGLGKTPKLHKLDTAKKYVTPDDEGFDELVSTSYVGFAYEESKHIPNVVHQKWQNAFKTLKDKGYFQVAMYIENVD